MSRGGGCTDTGSASRACKGLSSKHWGLRTKLGDVSIARGVRLQCPCLCLVTCSHVAAACCLSAVCLPVCLRVRRVYRQHQRPQFPPGTWPKYQHLAERCWSVHPEERPNINQIIHTLQQLLDAAGGPFTCASPFCA